jgi:hypothetical protein
VLKGSHRDPVRRAEAIENDAQFAALAGEILAEIGSSHLHIRLPERNVRTVGIAALALAIGEQAERSSSE